MLKARAMHRSFIFLTYWRTKAQRTFIHPGKYIVPQVIAVFSYLPHANLPFIKTVTEFAYSCNEKGSLQCSSY